MKKLIGLVFNRWMLLAVTLVALALVIWIVGPLIAVAEARPLETERARWTAIGAIALLAVLAAAFKAWRAGRGNAAVVSQLVAAAPAQEATETPDMAAVRERFERAMRTLRHARFGAGGLLTGWAAKLGGRYLYELPWYLFIGAPGSGKTTALHNCGLDFPLAPTVGHGALEGVGGTRHCDWWFTDRAVLIDTAGRFTTHDSDRETDRATWSGFLRLLRQSRPRQPINGVLVTVSVQHLLTRGAAERAQYAATVRQRLHELHEDLDIRFPVYLLVTMCDLMAGFGETFTTLDKDRRAAPWGFTFDLADKAVRNLARFETEFDTLHQRLNNGLIDRLQAEPDTRRRSAIYGFPAQFAGLRGALNEFVEAVFRPSPYEAETLWRGVYFVSGTQEGTPIDRVLGTIARSYRLERAIVAPQTGGGRSFFLTRLIGEVVFAESGLAGTNLAWERRRTLLAWGAYAAVATLTVGTLFAWGTSTVANRRYLSEVSARVADVSTLMRATPNRATADLLPVQPVLEATRALARPAHDGAVPWSLGFGLYQGRKIDDAARAAYERMLVDAVLPRLALRVEDQLRQAGNAPESQYEALKAYLMLHDPQHFDGAALKSHIEAAWDADFARSIDNAQRARLSALLDELLAEAPVVSPLPLDKALVDNARLRLARMPLPQRVYHRMRHHGLGREFPEFSITRAVGNDAALVFTRTSGAPLSAGVPGLFSYDGYHRGFQREVAQVAGELAQEQGWVLGISEARKEPAAVLRANGPLVDDVRRIYLTDYATAWESFIADIRLLPMTSMAQSIQMARMLSAPDSPLRPLLQEIARHTTLAGPAGKTMVEQAGDRAAGAVEKAREGIASLMSPKRAATAGDAPPLEAIVDDRFAALRQLVAAPPGGKPPLDDTIALIAEVQVLLAAADTAIKGGAAPPPSPLPNKLRTTATNMPQPMRSMLDTLADNSAKVSQIMVRQTLGGEVRSQVGEFCRQAIAGRYPVDRRAARDATQADFALLFGPGGKIDQLFQQRLATYVDTAARPWRFRPVDGTPLGLDAGSLPQFQRAAIIRETLFPSGNAPSLRLELKPLEMDASISQFVLDVDGQIVRYAHGPSLPSAVQWPGPRGSSQVRVQVVPPSAGGTSGLVKEGPWALFRLFDSVRIEPSDAPERFRATFDIDGRKAVFEVTTSSVRNPFRLSELAEFSCPAGL